MEGSKKKADELWSKAIRLRDKWCVRCGKRPPKHAHHIFSRRYNATRHDPANGAGLCGGCHQEVHTEPILWHEFIKKRMGEYTYNALMVRAHAVSKKADYKMRTIELEEYIKMLGKGIEKK